MLNIGLRKDAKDGFPVGRVVDIGTGKKFVDDALHLVIAEDLSIGNSRMTGQTQGQLRVER